MRRLFLGWPFGQLDICKAADKKMLKNIEQVYFFRDCLNYGFYVKVIAMLRGKGISVVYLGRVNLKRLVRRGYEDLVGRKN